MIDQIIIFQLYHQSSFIPQRKALFCWFWLLSTLILEAELLKNTRDNQAENMTKAGTAL